MIHQVVHAGRVIVQVAQGPFIVWGVQKMLSHSCQQVFLAGQARRGMYVCKRQLFLLEASLRSELNESDSALSEVDTVANDNRAPLMSCKIGLKQIAWFV